MMLNMSAKRLPLDYARLSPAERVLVIQDLWDDVATQPGAIELTPEQRTELNHRRDDLDSMTTKGRTWSEVKARITAKR